jgi:exonuclease III
MSSEENFGPKLRIFSLNICGLNNESKKLSPFLYDLKTQSFDIISLQETKVPSSKKDWAQNHWYGPSFWNGSDSASGGTAILFKKNFSGEIQKDQTILAENGRFILIPFKWQSNQYVIISIYAPNDHPSRLIFFQNIFNIIARHPIADDADTILLLSGDFNCVHDLLQDRINTTSRGFSFPPTLTKLMESYNLIDAYRSHLPNGKSMSRYQNQMGSRIDYLLVSKNLTNCIKSIHYIPNEFSDHYSILFSFSTPSQITLGKPSWKLNAAFLKKDIFFNQILNWLEVNHPQNGVSWLQDLILFTKSKALELEETLKAKRVYKLSKIRSQIKRANILFCQTKDPIYKNQGKKLKEDLEKLTHSYYTQHSIISSASYLDLGEQCSKYFFNLGRKRNVTNSITSLKDENGLAHSSTEKLLEISHQFYTSLYAAKPIDDEACDFLLSQIDKKVTNPNSLEGPIKSDEIEFILSTLPNGKSPGIDGIPYEFWKSFSKSPKYLAHLFNSWLREQVGRIVF